MEKGYKYTRTKCYLCGKMVADNWYVRHVKEKHRCPGKRQSPASFQEYARTGT